MALLGGFETLTPPPVKPALPPPELLCSLAGASSPGRGTGNRHPETGLAGLAAFCTYMRAAFWVYVQAHFSREEIDSLSQVPREIQDLKAPLSLQALLSWHMVFLMSVMDD